MCTLVLESLGVEVDGLFIDVGVTKTNQTADRDEKRNIFANPDDWTKCCFVALSAWLATIEFNESLPETFNHIFPGCGVHFSRHRACYFANGGGAAADE